MIEYDDKSIDWCLTSSWKFYRYIHDLNMFTNNGPYM